MDTAILSVDEAARILRVEPSVVTELLNDGELPGRIVGGEWRTTARALASFVDGVPLIPANCCGPDGACCVPGQNC